MKQEYDKALADFSVAIQLDLASTKSFMNRALIYEVKGEDKLAKADRKKAEELQNLEKQKTKK